MTLEKVHQKLQTQATVLIQQLGGFTEKTIQPCVEECESLQKELNHIQETLAVYKFQKANKEISPSFNIHSKISEITEKQVQPASPVVTPIPEPLPEPAQNLATLTEHAQVPEAAAKTTVVSDEKTPTPANLPHETPTKASRPNAKPLSIGLNDRFRFINELFLLNAAEYNIAIEQINALHTWHECDLYLSSLKQLYHWSDQNDTVKYFFAVVKKRFD